MENTTNNADYRQELENLLQAIPHHSLNRFTRLDARVLTRAMVRAYAVLGYTKQELRLLPGLNSR